MIPSPQRSIMVLRYRPYMMHPTWGVYNSQTPKVYNAMKNHFRPRRRWGAPPYSRPRSSGGSTPGVHSWRDFVSRERDVGARCLAQHLATSLKRLRYCSNSAGMRPAVRWQSDGLGQIQGFRSLCIGGKQLAVFTLMVSMKNMSVHSWIENALPHQNMMERSQLDPTGW